MGQNDVAEFLGGVPFNPDTVEPGTSFDALPTGNYNVYIEDSEFKATAAGDGHFLEVKLLVIDGKFKGRNLWDRMNLDNKNEVAVKIARQSLALICKSLAITQFVDADQLKGKSLVAVVKIAKGENRIRGYKPFADAQSVQAPAPQAQQAQQRQAPPVQQQQQAPMQQQQPVQQPVQQYATPQEQYVPPAPQQQPQQPQQEGVPVWMQNQQPQ
jgi:hypothetical protein